MFEVGDKVIRKTTEDVGYVHSIRKYKVLMVEVRIDATGLRQWFPAEEFRMWDKNEIPPQVELTRWGRTTPAYMVNLRNSKQVRDIRDNRNKRYEEYRLAESLLALSDKRKQRTRNKAAKLIKDYYRLAGD